MTLTLNPNICKAQGSIVLNGSHNYLRRSLARGDIFLNFKSDL